MTRYLASATRTALLADLASNGYEWKDEEGKTRIPNVGDYTSNHRGHTAFYLGHVPIGQTQIGTDDDGNPLFETQFSTDWCANVTNDTEATFATEIPEPANPYNRLM